MCAMRTGRAVPRQAVQFLESMGRNVPLFVLGGLFAAGAVCGSGLYGKISPQTSHTLMLLLSGSGTETAFRFWGHFGGVFLSNLSMLLVLFLCGFCAISQPLILLLPFIKGLGFGLVAAYNTVMLSPYSAFFWIKFMPGAFLSTALCLLCARQSLELSVAVYHALFHTAAHEGRSARDGRFFPPIYGARYLTLGVVCGVFSLLATVFDMIYEIVMSKA